MNRVKIDIIVIYSLLIFGILTGGITTIVSVVYAYVRKSSAKGTPYEQDYKDAIKIFWILFWISLLPLILFFIFCIIPMFGILLFSIFQ